MWDWLTSPATVVGGFATAIGVCAAFFALVFAKGQVDAARLSSVEARQTAREAGALQAYRDYLRLCFEYPQFTSTEIFLQEHPDIPLATITTTLTVDGERYQWFISILLAAAEQIILYVPEDDRWVDTIVAQLRYHAPAIRLIWPELSSHFGEAMHRLIAEALGE